MQYWFPIDPGEHLKMYPERADYQASGSFSASEQIILKWFDLNHLLKILNQMLDICSPHEIPETQRAFIGVAGQFAGQTELLATSGHLTYLLDTSAAHISALGTMIHSVIHLPLRYLKNAEWQIYSKVDDAGQHALADIVRRIFGCCDSVAAGDPQAVTAYVSRSMGRLLRTITSETQALTRHVTPVEGIVQGPPPEPTWLEDMVIQSRWHSLMGRMSSFGSLDWMIRMDGIRL